MEREDVEGVEDGFGGSVGAHNESSNVPTKVKLRVPLPWAEMRFTWSPMTSSAPSGRNPETSLSCSLILAGSVKRP